MTVLLGGKNMFFLRGTKTSSDISKIVLMLILGDFCSTVYMQGYVLPFMSRPHLEGLFTSNLIPIWLLSQICMLYVGNQYSLFFSALHMLIAHLKTEAIYTCQYFTDVHSVGLGTFSSIYTYTNRYSWKRLSFNLFFWWIARIC